MSGLTPEQIQDLREEIDGQIAPGATENQRAHAAVWLECRQVDALLAAAESLGKLEADLVIARTDMARFSQRTEEESLSQQAEIESLRAQLAARQKELDRQEELEAENCPEDQSWLQTLQAARRERDEALERLEVEQGEVSALNESRNRLEAQLAAREQSNAEMLAALFHQVYKLDDKPHQLFSLLRQMADKHLHDETRDETLRLCDVGYENARFILRGAAAEAEVERLKVLLRRSINPQGREQNAALHREIEAVLTHSVPPQTTETRG